MVQPLTPVDASQSFQYGTTNDSVLTSVAAIGFVTTTASITGLNSTGAAMFGTPLIITTKYTMPTVTSSAYPALSASTSNSYTLTTQKVSTPVVISSYTQYQMVNTTNTTVWNSQDSPSSLLLTVGGFDGQAIKNWAVVASAEQ